MEKTWEMYELFQAFLQAPSYHVALDIFLLMWVLWLLFHKSYNPEPSELTEQEKEDLINEWTPEPLVPPAPPNHHALKPRIVTGKVGKKVVVDGKECLNMATHNYLGVVENPILDTAAIKALRKYGVGSCGPRGFYGTVDIHLDLESQLAKFMGVEEAVLYSYGFAAISSAIPAYAKQGDIIYCDEGVHFPIQKGLIASRSEIKFFKHNDVDDFRRLVEEQALKDKKNPKKARVTKQFLVIEGLYMKYGDICPLPELVELKNKYKIRLFIDETCSFGVLGKTGRGVTEHYNIPVDEADLISGTLEYATGSFGGFCCGTSYVVDHQRLSGLGYCFSASLPPLQAAVALAALTYLEENPDIPKRLQENSALAHSKLKQIPQLEVVGATISPIKHLRIAHQVEREEANSLLTKIVDYAMEKNLVLTLACYLEHEEYNLPPPSIRLIVSAGLTPEEITSAIDIIQEACRTIL